MERNVKLKAKKALAAILSSALLVSVLPMSAMAAEVTKTYFDVDFDQSGDTDTAWTNKANSGYDFGYAGWGSAYVAGTALAEDSFVGSRVLEITKPKGSGAYVVGTPSNPVACDDSFDNVVTWYEISLKYDGAVTDMFVYSSDFAVIVDKDGTIRTANPQAATVNNYKLEEGKWYHIVAAIDNINKLGNDTSYYLWVNGTKLTTGETPMTGRTLTRVGSKAMSNLWINFGSNDNADAKVSIDNFKMYTTSGADDVAEYNPLGIFGDAGLEVSGYDVIDDTIYVPTNATVADVMGNVTVSGTGSAVYDGAAELDRGEWESAGAVGKSIMVYSDGCIFPREYKIAAIVADNYYDVNFDRSGDSPAISVNTAKNNMYFGYAGWGSKPSNQNELVKDEITGSTALEYNIPVSSGAYVVGNYDGGARCNDSFDNRVTWYEFSLKFDDALPAQMQLNATGAVFIVNENGTVFIGAPNSNAVNNLTLVPGEWYHFVIAYDNINKWSGKDTKIYAWADGKLLTTDESGRTGCTVTRSTGYSTTKMDRFYFMTSASSAQDSRMCLDNIRMYTTVNADDAAMYDPASKYAAIESDSWFVSGDALYIADDDWMLSDLADFVTSDGELVYCDGAQIVAEDSLEETEAPGKLIYVRAADKPVKKYRIDTGIFARAWYNGATMLGTKMSGYLTSLTESGIDTSGATKVKTFFWKSLGSLTPICEPEVN